MIALASNFSQRDPIKLTDPLLEHSYVIEQILDIIYSVSIDAETIIDYVDVVKFTIDFARKWEMSMITDIIRKELLRVIDSKSGASSHFEHFLVALHLGENAIATSMYMACQRKEEWSGDASGWKTTGYDNGTLGKADNSGVVHYHSDKKAAGLYGVNSGSAAPLSGDVFNFGIMPYHVFLDLSPTVVWIILRAQEIGKMKTKSVNCAIQELLDMACKCLSDTIQGYIAENRSTSQARRFIKKEEVPRMRRRRKTERPDGKEKRYSTCNRQFVGVATFVIMYPQYQ
jgi:hypothetical protein